jgi:hypothetical protein
MQKAEMLLGMQLVAKCVFLGGQKRPSLLLRADVTAQEGAGSAPMAGHQGCQGADWLAESVRRRQRVGCQLSFDCKFPGKIYRDLWVEKSKHVPKETRFTIIVVRG